MSGNNQVVQCKDCRADGITRPRPIAVDKSGFPVPGKRCATHHRAHKQASRQRRAEKRVETLYTLTADQYEALKAAQGGKCFICERATGASRRLSVDHNHATLEVRGLLCRRCNDLIGHLHDNWQLAYNIAAYLYGTPFATHILGHPVYTTPKANESRRR